MVTYFCYCFTSPCSRAHSLVVLARSFLFILGSVVKLVASPTPDQEVPSLILVLLIILARIQKNMDWSLLSWLKGG